MHCDKCGKFIGRELCDCRKREMIKKARQSQDIAELISRSLREQFLRGSKVAEVAYCEVHQ
jgi:hypothetical protein